MPFLVSLIVTVILIPLVIRYRIVDKPNYRSIHTRETPKAGGIAMLGGLLAGLGAGIVVSGGGGEFLPLALLMVGATALGLFDDLKNLSPMGKMLGQVILAALTVVIGYRFVLFGGIIDILLTMVWIIGFMNAFNLIDGMDGLAAGVAAISVLMFMGTGIGVIAPIGLPLLGALLGFLVFNFRPAKIFMGDTGSMLLGYLLAVLGIVVQQSAASRWVGAAVTLLILAYPVFDTVLSIVRRRINHKPIFAPDRSHSYNLLVDHLGLGYLTTVFVVYGIGLVLGLLGLFTYTRQSLPVAVLTVALAVAGFVVFVMRYNLLAESKYERRAR